MTRHRFAIVLALTLFLLASPPHPARACMCGGIEPDLAYQNALLVFTGTVAKITELTREAPQDTKLLPVSDGRIVTISVDEYFKGAGGPEIELRGHNTSCDIGFVTGKRYVVYASRDQQTGALGAFSCSRTSLLSDYSAPDISYLRRAVRGERPTMLYGFVFKNTEDSAKRGEPSPLADLVVTVEREGKSLELKTDARGYFETFDLPPGRYRIHTAVTGKLRGAEAQTVELGNGVASVMFRTTTLGSLSGRVVDREGKPVKEIQVELFQAGTGPVSGRPANYVSSGEDGTFAFSETFAGQYVLAVNPTGRRSLYAKAIPPSYFPNAASSADAQVITVSDGSPTDVGDFVLQERYPLVPISGVVVTLDGKPVSGAYVNLEQSVGGWDAARAVQTDSDGRFVHQAFEGVTYTLRAGADNPTGGTMDSDRVEVKAAKSAPPTRLVVKPQH